MRSHLSRARVRRLAAVLFAAAGAARGAEEAPQWLRELASAPAPAQDAKAPAVVLLHEERISMEDSGKITNATRFAVRILNKQGAPYAAARKVYLTDSGKVREFNAWMIHPSGRVKRYGKDEILDLAAANNDIFNEVRVRFASGSRDADPGAVFGYEATSEEKTVFTQYEWQFQNRLPVLTSRIQVSLPPGWRAQSVTFNHAPLEPSVSGSSYTWQMENLPYLEPEEASPEASSLSPRVAITCLSSAEARITAGKTFANWQEVSRWLSELNDPQAEPDAAIVAKAAALIQGLTSEFAKIEAIGRFAQSVNYVSIQTGLGRGGGYRPHAAADVLKKMYGDCKDKANLMRALLKSAGITSYPMSIYSGDRMYVRENWPSPQQFNHAILAVQVSDAVRAPAVFRHPKLGRLLAFDPTDPDVPPGLLPKHEQDSYALVIAGDAGDLVRMPFTPASEILFERNTVAALGADGSITGSVTERRGGEAAAESRGTRRALSSADFNSSIERWITSSLPGAKVEGVEPRDEAASGEFHLKASFASPRFAQSPQPRLLIFRAAVLRHEEAIRLADRKRRHPVVLDSESFQETVQVKVPAGFAVDELPEPVELKSVFGSFQLKWEAKGGEVVFTRRLQIPAATVPASQYAALKEFLDQGYGASEQPVVLIRR